MNLLIRTKNLFTGSYFTGRISLTLIFSFVLISIIPVGMMVAIALNQTYQQAYMQGIAQMESVAEIKIDETLRWLGDQKSILNVLATNPTIDAALIKTLNNKDSDSSLQSFLTTALNAQPIYKEFFVYDTKGLIRASTSDAQKGKVVNRQPYFSPSLAGEYIQPPFYEVITADLNIIISRPIADDTGMRIGVLAGRLKLDELSKIMVERVGLGETGETYLVSLESNYLVTASRFEGYPLNRAYHSDGIDKALTGKNGSGVYDDYRGIPTIGVYRWLPELNAAFLAEINQEEILAVLHNVRRFSVLGALIIGSMAVGIGIAIAIWITSPIITLKRVATAVALGDYSQRAKIKSHNEIDELADAFNGMAGTLVETIEALQKARSDLETRVEERTKDLQVANEEVKRFAYIVSHDLRAPLVNIKGFAGELRMGLETVDKLSKPLLGHLDKHQREELARTLEEDLPEALTFINASAERMDYFTNAILQLSRLGRRELRLEYVETTEIVQRILESLAHQITEHHTTITVSSLPKVRADRTAIEQIFGNLLTNAILYLDPCRAGEIEITSERQAHEILFQIRDNGRGIAEADEHKVFEPFRRAGKPTVPGEGMGLAYVQTLVRRHNGRIWFTSQPNVGTTFSFTICNQLTEEQAND